MYIVSVGHLSRVRLFVTPWTIAGQDLCPWDSPGENNGLGCHSFLRGSSWPRIEPGSPALQADSLQSEPPGTPDMTETTYFAHHFCSLCLRSPAQSSLLMFAHEPVPFSSCRPNSCAFPITPPSVYPLSVATHSVFLAPKLWNFLSPSLLDPLQKLSTSFWLLCLQSAFRILTLWSLSIANIMVQAAIISLLSYCKELAFLHL